jgi:hypothetical protein
LVQHVTPDGTLLQAVLATGRKEQQQLWVVIHRLRERRGRLGELVQIDGSPFQLWRKVTLLLWANRKMCCCDEHNLPKKKGRRSRFQRRMVKRKVASDGDLPF